MSNDTASFSETLPPKGPKCFANVFLSIFIALMWCSEGTRGSSVDKGVESQWRDSAQFPPWGPDWLTSSLPPPRPSPPLPPAGACPSPLPPPKQKEPSRRRIERSFYMPSMCSILKNIFKWLLCLWRVIEG